MCRGQAPTSAVTWRIPSWAAMMRAVTQLSPVSMWQASPARPSAATTPAASGFTGSATATAAASLPGECPQPDWLPTIPSLIVWVFFD